FSDLSSSVFVWKCFVVSGRREGVFKSPPTPAPPLLTPRHYNTLPDTTAFTEIPMRVSIRIVAGSLRGRKVVCNHSAELRPTPQMVREAFFSILGNAIPGRAFIDIFAGTGVVGIEALSRGAKQTLFVERDLRLAQELEKHLRNF